MAKELKLTKREREMVRERFTFLADGVATELADDVFDWLTRAGTAYLGTRRDSAALTPVMREFAALLDRLLADRVDTVRWAADDVKKNPPKFTDDPWPLEQLPVIERVAAWARIPEGERT